LTVAGLGYLASRFIPQAPSLSPTPEKFTGFNIWRETKKTLKVALISAWRSPAHCSATAGSGLLVQFT